MRLTLQVVMRLLWVLQNVPGIQELMANNQVRFGTLDTFLIDKFTGKREEISGF